mmetsp:Transcript_69686/g.167266  ORF Transcript_69686/g.167266 Transcript_69686/m.167266 type:complete len:178 (+) Transcript_69686:96-629(+)
MGCSQTTSAATGSSDEMPSRLPASVCHSSPSTSRTLMRSATAARHAANQAKQRQRRLSYHSMDPCQRAALDRPDNSNSIIVCTMGPNYRMTELYLEQLEESLQFMQMQPDVLVQRVHNLRCKMAEVAESAQWAGHCTDACLPIDGATLSSGVSEPDAIPAVEVTPSAPLAACQLLSL